MSPEFLVLNLYCGAVVNMNNRSSRKSAAVRTALCSAGAKLLFLPPFLPDLNAIEQVFAKLKLLLRKTAVARQTG